MKRIVFLVLCSALALLTLTACFGAFAEDDPNCMEVNPEDGGCDLTYDQWHAENERNAIEAKSDADWEEEHQQQQPPTGNSGDLDCNRFSTQREAQNFLNSIPGDPFNLDGDGDGVACELLP